MGDNYTTWDFLISPWKSSPFSPSHHRLEAISKEELFVWQGGDWNKEDYKITIIFSQIALSEFLSSLEKL